MHHILVIEDDPAVLFMIEATLDFGGYEVDKAATALDALIRVAGRRYDAVILDLGLPDMDGAHLIHTIRQTSAVPIIVVSGRAAEDAVVLALDSGADDFVPKPFLPGELLARIRALLRRHTPDQASKPREARRPASEGPAGDTLGYPLLAPLEEKLYSLLDSRRGRIVSVDEILDTLWAKRDRQREGHLRVLVVQLRRKLNAQSVPVALQNVRGAGYRLLPLAKAA